MNGLLILAILWVLASAVVAMLPMRLQYAPGLALLLAAPVLIVLIGREFGVLYAIVAALAFLSMFRHPIRYLTRRALGLPVRRPEDPPETPQ